MLLLLMYSTSLKARDSAWIKNHYYKTKRYITMRDGIRLFTAMYIPAVVKTPDAYQK